MPTQDTWSSIASVKQSNYNGRVRTWVQTPGFGSLPRDEKPVNRYDDMIRKYSQSLYSASNNGSYIVTPQYLYSGSALDSMFGTAFNASTCSTFIAKGENDALVKSLGSIADAKVNIGVAYAEASRTSSLILDTARRVDRAYRAFRRGNLLEVARQLNITPKRLHKSWLEYRYGWMPLLMDVKNGAEFFAQQHIGRKARFTEGGIAKYQASQTWYETYTPFGIPPTAQVFHRFTWETATRARVWCELDNPHLAELQQLGVTNPALIVWELIPFSFVFDWFISVGDWLQGLSAMHGVNVRRSMMSSLYDATYFRVYPAVARTSGSNNYSETGVSTSLQRRQYGRGIPSFNPADLSMRTTVVTDLSFKNLVTSLALIQGGYRGGNARI